MFRHGCEHLINCAIDAKATRRKPNLYVENLRSRLLCPGEARKVSKKQYKLPTNPKGSEVTNGKKFSTEGKLPRGISTVPRGLCARVRHTERVTNKKEWRMTKKSALRVSFEHIKCFTKRDQANDTIIHISRPFTTPRCGARRLWRISAIIIPAQGGR